MPGQFSNEERIVAKKWREHLNSLDSESTIKWLKTEVASGLHFSNIEEIKKFTDSFVVKKGLEPLNILLQLLQIPKELIYKIQLHYIRSGQPEISTFAPYASYVFKVDMFFYLCLASSFISKERASNKVDIAYLYYLPFCHVFVSKDKLHRRTATLFMEQGQKFVSAELLKAGLAATNKFFSKYDKEIEKVGIMKFVKYPPTELDNIVTELWDEFMRPDWREVEKFDPTIKSEDKDNPELVEALNSQLDNSKMPDKPINPDDVDFTYIKRVQSVRKGKWRVLPPEVEKFAK